MMKKILHELKKYGKRGLFFLNNQPFGAVD